MKLHLNTNINYSIRSVKDQLELTNQNRKTVNDDQVLDQIKLNYNLNNTYNLIYDVLLNRTSYTCKTPCTAGIKCQNSSTIPTAICAQNTLFFNQSSHIYIPNKVLHVLQKYVSKFQLRKVDADLNVAIEYCLLFLMQLDSTSYTNDNQNDDVWKSLNAAYLREFFTTDPLCYKKITDVMSTPTSKGTIIECDGIYIRGTKNYHYRLADNYRGKGYSSYKLQTTKAKVLLQNCHQKKWHNTKNNIICQNLIKFYQLVTLPTLIEIDDEADRLISMKYKNKKGKILKRLNKHSKSYFKDSSKYSFVEDAVKIFERLIVNGIMIPIPGGAASGGRVVDCFTLMPSWIRNLVKVNGKKISECDYSCLHPNLAISIYGGNSQYVTHTKIANSIDIDEHKVKVEHLAFFNMEVWQMKQSPLYNYYKRFENWMLTNIINEKQADNHKHKITSHRLFRLEVDIMTEVIRILNREYIYVGYVYDAIFFDPTHAERVKEVMDTVVIKLGVYTTAKLSK
ncbi:hypothetical protein QO200_17065 [Flavobacterium sp. Arc3]|uniref:hypothetical protein n=1 Tax=Flavobacterium sp. Arc3 TaxID=3046686 RepID=UPI00352F10AD